MRRLASTQTDLDLLYGGLTLPRGSERGATGPGARPWLALGMVMSADGAAAVAGQTAELGGAADRVAFGRLRASCDAILVGAGTVRDESYGPAAGGSARQADREQRGLSPRPRLVVVTGSLSLTPEHRIFSDPTQRPLIVTHQEAPVEREESLGPVADILRVGDRTVDLGAALDHLGELGLDRILCEGGPSLNAALLAEDLVDELFVTVAPVVVGGSAPRIVAGTEATAPLGLELIELHEHDGELVLRYRRAR